MKHKKKLLSVACLLLGIGGAFAQNGATTSGGEATGSGGTSSYSVGQVVYTTNSGSGGNITQGIQQPYEIYTLTDLNQNTHYLELSVHPNPTTNYLTLVVDDNSQLSFQLSDSRGKIIESKNVNNNSTNISLDGQPTATYLLTVQKNNQTIKTFKIIKN